MLLKHDVLQAIVDGAVTRVYRKWRKPTVKTGGTLTTVVGVIGIESVEKTTLQSITDSDARGAGYDSRKDLIAGLKGREGQLYCIRVRYVGEDPRVALRNKKIIDKADMLDLTRKLEKMGEWSVEYLELLANNKGVRAQDIADSIDMEKKPFKARVRKLKALGLTESLKIGYRLSARGRSFLARWNNRSFGMGEVD